MAIIFLSAVLNICYLYFVDWMACNWSSAEPWMGSLCHSSSWTTHYALPQASELSAAAGESSSAKHTCQVISRRSLCQRMEGIGSLVFYLKGLNVVGCLVLHCISIHAEFHVRLRLVNGCVVDIFDVFVAACLDMWCWYFLCTACGWKGTGEFWVIKLLVVFSLVLCLWLI